MPQGIARSDLTSDRRARYEELRLKKALITLFRIRDDLNPELFTRSEYLAEFDTHLHKGDDSGSAMNVDFDDDIVILVKEGYVEKLDKGYRVSSTGMALEETE